MAKLTRRRVLQNTVGVAAASISAALPALSASPLVLGFQMTTWGAVGMVARDLGLFSKAGASVRVDEFDSGVAVRDAMVAGRVDIGVAAVSSFIVGVDKGQLAAISTVAYSGRSNSIMVAAGSDINTVPGLKGRKVASQIGTGSDYTFKTKVLPKFGLNELDLQIVNVTYADQVSALASGSVDAFVGTEPYPSVAEYNKLARTLISFEKFDIVPVMLAVNLPVLRDRPDDLVAFMRGWLSAVRIFETDLPQATDTVWKVFVGKGYRLPETVIQSALGKLGVDYRYRPELPQYLQEQAEVLLKERKIQKLPDWKIALDHTILDRALKT
jgi:ABC-type nitrate/sulfonate/bicarbonate transport system substrate-binding protein